MPTSPTPADLLRAALDRAADLHERFAGSTCGTCADADGQAAAWPCETASALAVARQLLGTSMCPECRDTGACNGGPCPLTADAAAALGDGAVRCPLCPSPLMLHTPSGARAHFAHVHPEQQISGHQGPWPVLADAAPPAPADRAAVLREAADTVLDIIGTEARLPQTISGVYRAADRLRALADESEYTATPCSFGACEPGGEPCTTHERLMAHAEGDHELCDHAAGVQPPTSEAHPPRVEYIAEVLEDDGMWMYLGADPDPAVATRRRASVTRRHLDAETRTVRKTTTYTVEPEPAAPAAPEEQR
ncbi:hypothetical protein [Streptomyces sp. 020-2-3H-GM]|uniref:hypothetical protein n=1 Tax=Streptomyces sp. 020-2-3H-GM TaxID=2789258 RepID=UPI00397FBADA